MSGYWDMYEVEEVVKAPQVVVISLLGRLSCIDLVWRHIWHVGEFSVSRALRFGDFFSCCSLCISIGTSEK